MRRKPHEPVPGTGYHVGVGEGYDPNGSFLTSPLPSGCVEDETQCLASGSLYLRGLALL